MIQIQGHSWPCTFSRTPKAKPVASICQRQLRVIFLSFRSSMWNRLADALQNVFKRPWRAIGECVLNTVYTKYWYLKKTTKDCTLSSWNTIKSEFMTASTEHLLGLEGCKECAGKHTPLTVSFTLCTISPHHCLFTCWAAFFFFCFFFWQNLLSSLCINEHLELFSRAHGEHDCGHYAAMKSNVPALEMRTGLFRIRFFWGRWL